MTSVTIYHNPGCSKSRATLALLEENNIEFNLVEYLQNPLTVEELKTVAAKLGFTIRGILRTGENPYEEMNLADDSKSEDELAEAIVNAPILMQRPIVVKGGQARIGRPPESVLEIL